MSLKTSFSIKFLKHSLLSVVLLLGLVFFTLEVTKNITENPPTWMDEGIIIETARNFAKSGVSGIRISPDEIVSGGYVTTSYTVTYPISILFNRYGVNLFDARLVMVVYMYLALFASLLLISRVGYRSKYVYASTMFLIITFAPFYGHGKNVLGEIPGLFYLFVSMIVLYYFNEIIPRIEVRIRHKLFLLFIASVFTGLAIVTKPIYILIIPAIIIGGILYIYTRYRCSKMFEVRFLAFKKSLWVYIPGALLGLSLPIFTWLVYQFHGESLKFILSVYANPHKNDLINSIVSNSYRFISELQPAYTLAMLFIWFVVLLIRFKRKENITLSEYILFSFSVLVLLAYIRTPGYYRYFIQTEIISLIFLSSNLLYLSKGFIKTGKILFIISIIGIVGIQSYQMFENSWIYKHGDSQRSELLKKELGSLSSEKEVFLYQAPEVATFIPHDNYSQYLEVTSYIKEGNSSLRRVEKGLPYILVTKSDESTINLIKTISNNKYKNIYNIDRYTFFKKI